MTSCTVAHISHFLNKKKNCNNVQMIFVKELRYIMKRYIIYYNYVLGKVHTNKVYHIWIHASLCTNIYLSIKLSFNKLLTLNDLVSLVSQRTGNVIKICLNTILCRTYLIYRSYTTKSLNRLTTPDRKPNKKDGYTDDLHSPKGLNYVMVLIVCPFVHPPVCLSVRFEIRAHTKWLYYI